jgi:hypothetical protein
LQLPIRYGQKRTLAPLAKPKFPSLGLGLERPTTPARGHNLDSLLVHLDVSFVADWLQRANASLTDLQVRFFKLFSSLQIEHAFELLEKGYLGGRCRDQRCVSL